MSLCLAVLEREGAVGGGAIFTLDEVGGLITDCLLEGDGAGAEIFALAILLEPDVRLRGRVVIDGGDMLVISFLVGVLVVVLVGAAGERDCT